MSRSSPQDIEQRWQVWGFERATWIFAGLLLLVVSAGLLRGCELAAARTSDTKLVVLADPAEAEVDLILSRDEDGFSVAHSQGAPPPEVLPGGGFRLSLPESTIEVLPAGDRAPSRLVTKIPWSVMSRWYGAHGLHKGWTRLDIGADPTGELSGVPDLVLVDPDKVEAALPSSEIDVWRTHRQVAWIRPLSGDQFRLSDEGWRIEPRVPGLVLVRGGQRSAVGRKPTTMLPGDVLELGEVRLAFTLTNEPVSKQVEVDGATQWVLRRRAFLSVLEVGTLPEGGRARVGWSHPDGSATFDVPVGSRIRFVGIGQLLDRTSPGPLPETYEDREFVRTSREAFEAGLVYEDRGMLGVLSEDDLAVLASEEPDPDRRALLEARLPALTLERWDAATPEELDEARQIAGRVAELGEGRLARVLRRYNARLVPASLGVSLTDVDGDELRLAPVTWQARRDGGPWVPATDGVALSRGSTFRTWLWYPEAWQPLALDDGQTLSRSFRVDLPLGAHQLALSSTGVLAVSVDEQPLPLVDGTAILPDGARQLQVDVLIEAPRANPDLPPALRLALRSESPLEVRAVEAVPGGGSSVFDAGEDAWLDARVGDGWLRWPGDAFPEGALGSADLDDPGWLGDSVGQVPPAALEAPSTRLRRFRVMVDSQSAGSARLELVALGQVLTLTADGEPIAVDLSRGEGGLSAGSARLPLHAGSNRIEVVARPAPPPPPRADPEVRLAGGVPTGVRPGSQVVLRPAPAGLGQGEIVDRDGRSAPALVAVGRAGVLSSGDRVVLGRGLNRPSNTLLLFGQADGDIARLADGTTLGLRDKGIRVVAGSRTTLWRQMATLPYLHPEILQRKQLGYLEKDRERISGGSGDMAWQAVLARHHDRATVGEVQWLGGPSAVQLHIDGVWAPLLRDDTLLLTTGPDGSRVFGYGVRLFRVGEGEVAASSVLLPGDRIIFRGTVLRYVEDDGRLTDDAGARPELGLETLIDRPATGLAALFNDALRSGDVKLTLDDDLQLQAREILYRTLLGMDTRQGPAPIGAVLAMDAVTGDILVAVDGSDSSDPARALMTWQDHTWHPGSTFKPITGAALATSKDPVARQMVTGELPQGFTRTQGYTLKGMALPSQGGEGEISLHSPLKNHSNASVPADMGLVDALATSRNTWFGYASLLLHTPTRAGWRFAGLPVGIADRERALAAWPVAATAEAMGFNRVFDLDASGRATRREAPAFTPEGRLYAPGDVLYSVPGQFPLYAMDPAEVANTGIGQGEVYATPLAVAMVQATFGADGVRPTPALVDGIRPDGVRVLGRTDRALLDVQAGLRQVVADGTATSAFKPSPWADRVSGKTGTAERPGGADEDDAWFAGVVMPPEASTASPDPTRHPVAFAVLLPRGGLASRSSALLASDVVDAIGRRNGW